MKEPLSLDISVKVTDAEGTEVISDTMHRNNMSYQDLVTFQGVMTEVTVSMQKLAEAKAKKK